MNKLLDKNWWADTAERAIKTFSQTALGFITIGVTGIADVQWEILLSVSGVAALASLLMRFATVNDKETVVEETAVVIKPDTEQVG